MVEENYLIYVDESDQVEKMLEYTNKRFSLTGKCVNIVTIINLEEEQTAFLSLNNIIVNDYRKNAKELLDKCYRKLAYLNAHLSIKTNVLEGKVGYSIAGYAKGNHISHLIFSVIHERDNKILTNVVGLNIPVTILPSIAWVT